MPIVSTRYHQFSSGSRILLHTHATSVCSYDKLQIINTSSDNFDTLKDRTKSDLHVSSCLPDKIRFISSSLTTIIIIILIPSKIW